MNQTSYPKQEHLDYVHQVARCFFLAWSDLVYVNTIPEHATTARRYLVGVRKPDDKVVHRLQIAFQIVERCLEDEDASELLGKLEKKLENLSET